MSDLPPAPLSAPVPTRPPSAFAVLRRRSFRLLWSAQLVSVMGTSLTALAASIYVFDVTGSALGVGLMLMATAVPSLAVGLIAGVFVDRWDRKKIMIVAECVRALLVVLIPLLLPYGIGWLYVMVILVSAGGQFYEPAHASVLPEIATDEELGAANALMQVSAFGSTAVGFAASGLIASQFSIDWAFYFNGVAYATSAAFVAAAVFRSRVERQHASAGALAANLRQGIRYLVENRLLRSVFAASLPAFFGIGLLNAVLLPFAIRALDAGEFEYGLIEAISSVGFVVGALLMARLADAVHAGQWMALSFLGVGVACGLMSFTSSVAVAAALYAVAGFMNAPNYVARSLAIQRSSVREVRGRVNSAFLVTRNVLFVAGMAAAGLADVMPVRTVYLGGALVMVGAAVIALLLPELRRPSDEWRRIVSTLRAASTGPVARVARPPTLADLDLLAGRVPGLAGLSDGDRALLVRTSSVIEAPPGSAVVRQGEDDDRAYFILDGVLVAGQRHGGTYRSLRRLGTGDVFGEIAALTGSRRTADVVTEAAAVLLAVPATTLRELASRPEVGSFLESTVAGRLGAQRAADHPRFAGLDQQELRELAVDAP